MVDINISDVPFHLKVDTGQLNFSPNYLNLLRLSIPEYLLRGAVDVVRCDTLVDGGITPVKKIADICDAFGVQCEIHQHAGGAVDIANLHVECAIKNSAFHEMFWPDIWRYGIKEAWDLDNEGYLHIPQKPGLGVEINWEAIGKPIASY
ncbi:unnamed protein product [marine sediment metagenome]|uniref:Enolase C-terminal domain-containing protein n=1 Tax=marine sediment metagenome TaxID=412755 RepID=X1SYH5_9ZZZZ